MIPLASFDLETTGVDPETARIVSAAIVLLDQHGDVIATNEWLINPGVPIPAGATEVHGITDEHVAAHGIPAREGIEQIATYLADLPALADAAMMPLPLVVFNAPYDLTVLDREVRRHEVGIVGDIGGPGGLWWEPGPVVDPLVIDKTIDRYRKGKRTLTALAAHLDGIEFDGEAHGALADATTAGRIAQRMLEHKTLREHDLATLHTEQVEWARTIATGLADYFHSIGQHDKALGVSGSWPMVPPRAES